MLNSARIVNFDSMAFRFPTAPDLEEYLKRSTRMKAAYREDSGEVVVFQRSGILPWEEYKAMEDTGPQKTVRPLCSGGKEALGAAGGGGRRDQGEGHAVHEPRAGRQGGGHWDA